jgi:hypothetical protein
MTNNLIIHNALHHHIDADQLPFPHLPSQYLSLPLVGLHQLPHFCHPVTQSKHVFSNHLKHFSVDENCLIFNVFKKDSLGKIAWGTGVWDNNA